MREILFRGKDIKGNWYEGLLAHNIAKDEWYISNKAGIPTAYQIRPETIGQFTGLTDKNGVKIFEGDVVKIDGNGGIIGTNKMVVAFETGVFYLCHNARLMYLLRNWHDYVEVVGNLYDNPELFEEGDAK